jgi:glycosyltransferase involved in cell wall biosynthesis
MTSYEDRTATLAQHSADVTVIVPTYNRAHFLREALESILNQSRSPAEVILVDDGSTDGTCEVAKSFGDRIRYLRKENGGKPAAVNLALKLVRSEYVIIADDDDIMFPSGLAHVLEPLERDAALDFANGGITYFGDISGRGRVELSCPPTTKADTGHHFEALLLGYSMHVNATLIRHRCFTALGGLDESFRRSEDYEFMLRLTQRFRGISVLQRITSLRRHDGERGDAQIRHSARERQLIHFDFDVRAFERVRREVPIGAYIGKPDGNLTEQECFDAWFVRAATMARHGVWQGFRKDIHECARRTKLNNVLVTDSDLNKLTAVFSRSDTIEAGLRERGYPGWIVRAFISAVGRGAIRPIARGFYYAARDAYSDGSRALALRCMAFALWTFTITARRK